MNGISKEVCRLHFHTVKPLRPLGFRRKNEAVSLTANDGSHVLFVNGDADPFHENGRIVRDLNDQLGFCVRRRGLADDLHARIKSVAAQSPVLGILNDFRFGGVRRREGEFLQNRRLWAVRDEKCLDAEILCVHRKRFCPETLRRAVRSSVRSPSDFGVLGIWGLRI